ncbi:Hypothetical predicted protein, partial [Paramuricea clavata]
NRFLVAKTFWWVIFIMAETDKLTLDPEKGDREEEPPKKKSMMEEIKEAKQQSANSFSFAKIFCGIVFGSIIWTVMLAIFNIIPITIIVI